MKRSRKKSMLFLIVAVILSSIFGICEWWRVTIDHQFNDVLDKGWDWLIPRGQTQEQYFDHSMIINNRLVCAEFILGGLAILCILITVGTTLKMKKK